MKKYSIGLLIISFALTFIGCEEEWPLIQQFSGQEADIIVEAQIRRKAEKLAVPVSLFAPEGKVVYVTDIFLIGREGVQIIPFRIYSEEDKYGPTYNFRVGESYLSGTTDTKQLHYPRRRRAIFSVDFRGTESKPATSTQSVQALFTLPADDTDLTGWRVEIDFTVANAAGQEARRAGLTFDLKSTAETPSQ